MRRNVHNPVSEIASQLLLEVNSEQIITLHPPAIHALCIAQYNIYLVVGVTLAHT